MKRLSSLAVLAAVVSSVAAIGCGLISDDVLDFDLKLPRQEFAVDTSRFMIQGATIPTVPCTSDSMCQILARNANPNPMFCGTNPAGSCEARIDIQATVAYDLKSSNEFAVLNDKPVVEVTISKIQYEIVENTLTFATPPIGLYVAPANVMDAQLATQFGTVDPIAPGTAPGLYDVKLTPNAKDTFAATIQNYKTPFNLLVKNTVPATFKAGDAVPQGRLRVVVLVTATASP